MYDELPIDFKAEKQGVLEENQGVGAKWQGHMTVPLIFFALCTIILPQRSPD